MLPPHTVDDHHFDDGGDDDDAKKIVHKKKTEIPTKSTHGTHRKKILHHFLSFEVC